MSLATDFAAPVMRWRRLSAVRLLRVLCVCLAAAALSLAFDGPALGQANPGAPPAPETWQETLRES